MTEHEILDRDRSVVVAIDLQGKLLEMAHRWELTLNATDRLLRIAGIFEVPVLLTEQYPEGLGRTHAGLRATYDTLETPKRHVEKLAFGCCGDEGFRAALDELMPGVPPERRQVVVAGIETHVCVMQTVLELLRDGSQVHVCWECVSGRGEEYRRHALDRMQQAGACLTNHESVGFEWARTKEHPRFRDLNRLLREGQLT